MCGIAGAIDFYERPKVEECLSGMIGTMRRRGPDDMGIDVSEHGILFHTRLVVVDAENGRQPMKAERNGERYTIVYNGELYNTEELRAELASQGVTFRGHSDTEVLLAAYIQWGAECLPKLNGIFAFAVLHQNEKRLFFARDRVGVKPFFYSQKNNTLIFASEIKTLLKYPDVKPVIDHNGITELLLIGPGRTPGCGVFRDISELRPGHYGIYDASGIHIENYWKLQDHKHTDSLKDTIEKVRYLVTDSIKRQLVSDVPVGTFLSGGLDSSIISSVAANHFRKQGERLSTFSVTYTDQNKYFQTSRFQPTSDDSYIGKMVDYLDSNHRTFTIDNEQLAAALFTAVDARDLPGMADVDSSLVLFCEEIKKHVTVALSGECADEIFGGYPWYRDEKNRSAYGFPWAQSTEMRSRFFADSIIKRLRENEDLSDSFAEHYGLSTELNNNHSNNPDSPNSAADTDCSADSRINSDFIRSYSVSQVNSRYEQSLSEVSRLPGLSPTEKRLREMVHLNTYWFMQTLLDRKERMSMYNGLEVRVPFCDHRIAEYMYSVPWEIKEFNGMEKGLLREAVKGLLPEEIRTRKKSPYPKTHNPQYMSIVSGMLSDLLKTGDAPILSLVSRNALTSLLNNELTQPFYGQLMTAPQTIAYMLQLNYWLEKYKVKIDI